MILEQNCDLLEYPLDAIGHFCNAQHVMGGGLALRVKTKYPDAYKADLATIKGDIKKMGTFSYAVLPSNKHIINIYTQYNFGYGTRHTNYEYVYNGLTAVNEFLITNGLQTFGLPKNAGCRLGGGDWRIIRSIIEVIFDKSPLTCYICNYDK